MYGEKKSVRAIRELDKAVVAKGMGKSTGGKDKTLNDWLAEEEEEGGNEVKRRVVRERLRRRAGRKRKRLKRKVIARARRVIDWSSRSVCKLRIL